MSDRAVWAFVCHKPYRFGGVISPELGKAEVRKFCGKFAAEGYTVTPVYNRTEYEALLASIKEPPI